MTSRKTKSAVYLLALSLALPACGDLSDVPAVVVNVDYRPDGQLVVFTSGGIKTYQGDFAKEIGSFPIGTDNPYDLQYKATHLSDDGQVAAVTFGPGRQGGKTVLHRIPDGGLLGSLQSKQFVALSPKGDLAFVYGEGEPESPPTSINALYNLSDGRQLWSVDYLKLAQPPNYCHVLSSDSPTPAFTPDGATMFLAIGEHLVVADVLSGANREIANVHACIGGLTLLPDGTLLVLHGVNTIWGFPGQFERPLTSPDLPDAAQPNSFAIYAQDGTLLRQLPAFEGYYTEATTLLRGSMFCSPVGDRCAMFVGKKTEPPQVNADGIETHGRQSFVLVWSLDGTLLYTIPAPAHGTAAFSPDGSRLAIAFSYSYSVTSSARIYRAEDGVLLAERTYTQGVF